MSWTDERIETLRRLWGEGQSAAQIASTLGGVSRNAVIGKIHRLGLSGRVKAPQARAARGRAAATLPRKVGAASPPPARAMAAGALAVKVVERELVRPAALPEAEIVPLHGGISLFELTATACRWPLGDPAGDELTFCGARVAAGDVYCRCHAEVAFPARRKKPH